MTVSVFLFVSVLDWLHSQDLYALQQWCNLPALQSALGSLYAPHGRGQTLPRRRQYGLQVAVPCPRRTVRFAVWWEWTVRCPSMVILLCDPVKWLQWCHMRVRESKINGNLTVQQIPQANNKENTKPYGVSNHWQTQLFVHANNKETNKGLHYLPFVRGIHRSPVDSPSQWASNVESISMPWHLHAWLFTCWLMYLIVLTHWGQGPDSI